MPRPTERGGRLERNARDRAERRADAEPETAIDAYRREAPPREPAAADDVEPLFGGIEGGGTKFKCIIGRGPDDIQAKVRLPTEDPKSTLQAVVDFFVGARLEGLPVDAVGIGAFGPIDLDPNSRTYGRVLRTPKPGWSGADVLGALTRGLKVPVAIDTDTATAAIAEHRWGAAQGLDSFLYLTVGTGIGGTAIVDGKPIMGAGHPEMGHIAVPLAAGDKFAGVCPYHGACWEGLANGPALEARFGMPAQELGGDALKRAIELETGYLAAGLASLVYTVAPQRILLGGGVSLIPGLMAAVREQFALLMADYPGLAAHQDPTFIRAPGLGGAAGALGGVLIAEQAFAATRGA